MGTKKEAKQRRRRKNFFAILFLFLLFTISATFQFFFLYFMCFFMHCFHTPFSLFAVIFAYLTSSLHHLFIFFLRSFVLLIFKHSFHSRHITSLLAMPRQSCHCFFSFLWFPLTFLMIFSQEYSLRSIFRIVFYCRSFCLVAIDSKQSRYR